MSIKGVSTLPQKSQQGLFQGDSNKMKKAVDILNATLILLKKESTRYDKQQNLAWNHAHVLTPKGMKLMEKSIQ
jgi:hypothetical protein